MKYGILSDCHCNFEGLKATSEMLLENGAEKLICLGDIVGYGALAKDCIDYIQENFLFALAGNHDFALLDMVEAKNYNRYAIESLEMNRSSLSDSHIKWLESLPLKKSWNEQNLLLQFTHAHPKDYKNWCYYPKDLYYSIHDDKEKIAISFYGHTHIPGISIASQTGFFESPDFGLPYDFSSNLGETIVINVGSCGQPRDGDYRACGILLDTDKQTITFLRTSYALKKNQKAILDAGLPEYLANRLIVGK
ncbi:MAG: metallophosphoesterase family protein [Candidatus Cloacimonetes bacterium]|nr:metallophosphoesterase family protein [Candidatus Cloacimonadota bacterium]